MSRRPNQGQRVPLFGDELVLATPRGLATARDDYVLARNNAWLPGIFSMITGFVEGGETPEQTPTREVEEELDLQVIGSRFLGHFSMPTMNQLIIAFVATCRGTPKCGSELAEVRRLGASDLRDFDFGPLVLTKQIADAALSTRVEFRGP